MFELHDSVKTLRCNARSTILRLQVLTDSSLYGRSVSYSYGHKKDAVVSA